MIELDKGQEGRPPGIGDDIDASRLKEGERLAVTIEVADLEKDSAAVAAIYSQDDIIIHLAGVAPGMLDEKKYQDLRNEYGPLIAATADGVKGYYRRHQDEVLYVAKTDDRKVVGVVTSQPPGVGVRIVTVGRLGVDTDYRRSGVARKLVERVRDEAFKNPNISQIDAAILILGGPEDSGGALSFFRKLGFTGITEASDTCISWSPKVNDFVGTGSFRLSLPRNGIIRNSL